MLGRLFGFRGRMGRLSYFGWAMLVSVIWLVWLFAIVGGLAVGLAKASIGALLGSGLLAVAGVIPIVWMFLALTTKRLRDAGFPPVLVVPAMLAFTLFDVFVLARQTGGPTPSPFVHSSPMGLCVNLAYGLVLLFWPSAGAKAWDGDDEARRPGEVPWHERAGSVITSLPAQQAAAAYAPPMASHGQARTFGRRRA